MGQVTEAKPDHSLDGVRTGCCVRNLSARRFLVTPSEKLAAEEGKVQIGLANAKTNTVHAVYK